MELPPVGSLVVPSPDYRASMDTGEGAALLMGVRRGSASLYYPALDRSFWVPTGKIRAIPPEAVPEGCLERFLSGLLRFLDADECVIDEAGEGAMRLAVDAPGLSRDQLRELLSMLGTRLADYAVEPGSMRAVLLRLDLVSLPDAAGAGT